MTPDASTDPPRWNAFKILVLAVAAVFVYAVYQGMQTRPETSRATDVSPPTPKSFDELLNTDASCAELFDARNDARRWLNESETEQERMNTLLQEVGCFTSGATRRTRRFLTSRGTSAISSACISAVRYSASIYLTGTNDEIGTARERMYYDCQTVDAWIGAVRQYPRAIGLTPGATITEADLWNCSDYRDSPVCRDLKGR